MPIYEYECIECGNRIEKIESITRKTWQEERRNVFIKCDKCGNLSAKKIVTRFKIGSKILDTTGKSGYDTDHLTMGKLIDEGGIPYEEKARLRERDKMIKRQKEYTKELNERAKKYKFDTAG